MASHTFFKTNLNLLLGCSIFGYCSLNQAVQAQVIEDGTLSTEVSTDNNLDFTVNAGETRGTNLFHSFAEFSVPNNGSVFFNNGLSVQNIITRVTGSAISNINGLIKSNGIANLFLINPNGIIFGENARLDIGGSFIGTTAASLVFEDGIEFSTDLADSEPLLTLNVPLGLQFGSNPGNIINRANFSSLNVVDPIAQAPKKLGLSITQNNTLALLGGDINFDGGAVATFGGNIELGSVAENSLINLESIVDGWSFNYDNVSQFQNIKLDNLAVVDASGEGAGNINVRGKDIQILNGSAIVSNTLGAINGGEIQVQASDSLEISGSDRTGTKIDLLLASRDIFLPFASQIISETFGSGTAGDIEIIAHNFQLMDGAEVVLQTFPGSTGNGGNVMISVDESITLGGSRPLLGLGENANNLIAPFSTIDIAIEVNQGSSISNVALSNGDGGDINISTSNLNLNEGALIAVTPFSTGNAGNINIEARESVNLIGASEATGSVGSLIAGNTFSSGDSGNITIHTNTLLLDQGGQISSATSNTGNAGNIIIEAITAKISGINSESQLNSLISSEAIGGGIGGDIFLNADTLAISDRASISVEGVGSSTPGNLTIQANSIDLTNFASITAATELQSGGNIELKIADNLTLAGNSLISAQAFGDADGGNIKIEVGFIIAVPNSNNDILATAIAGDGGNITILGNGIFGIQEGLSKPPNSSNDIDASSQFGIDGIVSFNFPEANESQFSLPETITLLDDNNLIGNNFCQTSVGSEYYFIGKGGIAISPERDLNVANNWTDFRFFEETEAVTSEASMPTMPTTENQPVPKIEMVRGWFKDRQGQIVLTANPIFKTAQESVLLSPSCNSNQN